MKQRAWIVLCLVLATTVWAAAQTRTWQTGTLLESEQQKVLESSTRNTNSSGKVKDGSYSQDSTTTKTDNYDTFQISTISAGAKTYVAREQLYFPWSKPTLTTVGEPVKFALDKNKMYILGEDGKEHKMTVVKVSLKEAPAQ